MTATTMSPATTKEITHPPDPDIPISCPEVTNNPIPIVPLKAMAVIESVGTSKIDYELKGLTCNMMSFELPVKSIVVKKSTSDVVSCVFRFVVGATPAACAYVIIICSAGFELQQTVKAFSIRFDNRHFAWGSSRGRKLCRKFVRDENL